MAHELEKYVKSIPDFPKKGIIFRDVTGLLDSAEAFRLTISELEKNLKDSGITKIAAPESRGFIFASPLADRLGVPFIPIRKPGKLPRPTISEAYALEYGEATIHIHTDAIQAGDKVAIIDDLLATGGTALAAARLVERLGGSVVKILFPIELEGFAARSTVLKSYDVVSLVKYPGK